MLLAATLSAHLVAPSPIPRGQTQTATASPDRTVRWRSVEHCPSESDFTEQLDALLGPQAAVHTAGILSGNAGAFHLELEIEVDGRREQRALNAADCALLTRAGVLVVAVTTDALGTATVLAPPIASSPIPPAPVGRVTDDDNLAVSAPSIDDLAVGPIEPRPEAQWADRPVSSPAERDPRTAGPLGMELAARAGVGVGLTPRVGAGFEGIVGLRLGRLRVMALGF
ncbi:MAG: hypothetical protein K0V04_06995, partial [Deltaproteobacteria bacterium]|nr:hypothetical protein [Deltaproteobacteria bacterium]